jgi:hypothetical protein
MTATSPNLPRLVAIGGSVLSVLSWLLFALAARSVFGDFFASSEAERAGIAASIDFAFRVFGILAAAAFAASIAVAAWSWRRVPNAARITVAVHVLVITVLVVGTWL